MKLIDRLRLARTTPEIIFDLDSTHSIYRKQEKTDYNAHYQSKVYRPLLAFDGLTDNFL